MRYRFEPEHPGSRLLNFAGQREFLPGDEVELSQEPLAQLMAYGLKRVDVEVAVEVTVEASPAPPVAAKPKAKRKAAPRKTSTRKRVTKPKAVGPVAAALAAEAGED